MENHNLNMIIKRESLNKSIIINKRITTYDVGISGPCMEQPHKCATISLICLVSELLVFHTLYSHSEVVGVHIKN
jgi:hypothetical protein